MKNLGKLKLKQLKKEELERREMNALKGHLKINPLPYQFHVLQEDIP